MTDDQKLQRYGERPVPSHPHGDKFYGQIRKVKDGSLVMPDQCVVFLAKDNAFAAILPDYVRKCQELGADPRQIEGAKRMAGRVLAWREAHPELCKVPDIAEGEKLLEEGR